jgi:hypothetical protein
MFMSFLIDPKLFASNMRYFRGRQSFTVKELAARIQLTTSVVQALESGNQVPTESQLSSCGGPCGQARGFGATVSARD